MGPDTAQSAAIRVMLDRKITGAPVVDEAGYPVGVVSLTDLADPLRHNRDRFGFDVHYQLDAGEFVALGSGQPLKGGRVRELMSRGVVAVSGLSPLSEAAALMLDNHIHRLLVIDGDRMRGILTSLDLARGLLQETHRDRVPV